MSLPIYGDMTNDQIEYEITELEELVKNGR